MEQIFLVAPILRWAVTTDLANQLKGDGIPLGRNKWIREYSHPKDGGGWERFHYPETDPKKRRLEEAKFAFFMTEGDAESAQTVAMFMKFVRDGDLEIDCWHKGTKGGPIKNIHLNDSRASRGKNAGLEKSWEAVQYTLDDMKLVAQMSEVYFDKIVSSVENNKFMSVFNGINFARVTFSITNWDQRIFIPLLGTALECLFSSGKKTEITHQIAENIAWFLFAEDEDKRYEAYSRFKQFYSLRSEIVHEGYSETELNEQRLLYENALDYLRDGIKKILLSPELLGKFETRNSKEKFLLSLVLGSKQL